MGGAVAAGQLHDAEAVAQGAQPKRLRINGHGTREGKPGGEIVPVDLDAQLPLRPGRMNPTPAWSTPLATAASIRGGRGPHPAAPTPNQSRQFVTPAGQEMRVREAHEI